MARPFERASRIARAIANAPVVAYRAARFAVRWILREFLLRASRVIAAAWLTGMAVFVVFAVLRGSEVWHAKEKAAAAKEAERAAKEAVEKAAREEAERARQEAAEKRDRADAGASGGGSRDAGPRDAGPKGKTAKGRGGGGADRGSANGRAGLPEVSLDVPDQPSSVSEGVDRELRAVLDADISLGGENDPELLALLDAGFMEAGTVDPEVAALMDASFDDGGSGLDDAAIPRRKSDAGRSARLAWDASFAPPTTAATPSGAPASPAAPSASGQSGPAEWGATQPSDSDAAGAPTGPRASGGDYSDASVDPGAAAPGATRAMPDARRAGAGALEALGRDWPAATVESPDADPGVDARVLGRAALRALDAAWPRGRTAPARGAPSDVRDAAPRPAASPGPAPSKRKGAR